MLLMMHPRKSIVLVCALTSMAWNLAAADSNATSTLASTAGLPPHAQKITGCFGTYAASIRTPSGRVNCEALLADLLKIKARTYNWLIWHQATDWDDFQLFLPLAAKNGVQVWVTLVPPSESPPRTKNYSEPFKLDYDRWGVEIAKLSLREPALVAWSIDDFLHNTKHFTPERTKAILDGARAINPKLAFVPCCYFRQVNATVAKQYGPLLDGLLFPYRHEMVKADLVNADTVEAEVARLRELLGRSVPIIVDVYATRHSSLGDSSPTYVRDVMTRARACADGVLIYCHQDEKRSPGKYSVIKELFNDWSALSKPE